MPWILPFLLLGGTQIAKHAEASAFLREYECKTKENSKNLSRICLESLAASQRPREKTKEKEHGSERL